MRLDVEQAAVVTANSTYSYGEELPRTLSRLPNLLPI